MARFQWRRNTAAGAASNNAVLAAGEPGIATDTHVLKVGDGATAWVDLPEVGSLTYGPKTQRAGYRISAAGSTTTNSSVATLHARIPFKLPVNATRLRVHVWNRDTKLGGAAVTTGAITYYGMYVGECVVDSTTGAPTSSFTATPTRVDGGSGFTTDATGATESVTPWTTLAVKAGKDMLLSLGFSSSGGQVHNRSQGAGWFLSTTTAESQNNPGVAVPPNALSSLTSIFHDVWIEYETVNGAAHGLIVGDSLSSGTSTTWPFRDGYVSQTSNTLGYAASAATWHGTTLQSDWGTSEPKWAFIQAVTQPTWVDIGLGSNDFGNSRTLAQVQADLGTLITNLRAVWDVPIYARTVLPRGLTGQPETDRLAFNTWLTARPFSIAGVFDTATPVANGSALIAAYNAGDGIHLNTLGQFVQSKACQPRLRFIPGSAF
jgi:hypothetical protein